MRFSHIKKQAMKAVTQKSGGFFIFLEKNETFPLSHSYEIQKNIYGKNKKYKERSIMGNHSIQVNSMTKMYRNFMNIYGEKKSPADFLDTLAKKQNGKMSMDEYKEYIYDKISKIPIHSSQSGWQWSIQITDQGFEAMKQNPEYEAEVLEAIRANFSFNDRFHSQNYSVLRFGASKEESYGQSFGGGNPAMEKEESFWERRAKRRKKLQEQYDEMLDQKAAAKQLTLKEFYAALAEGRENGQQTPMPLPFYDYGLTVLETMEEE